MKNISLLTLLIVAAISSNASAAEINRTDKAVMITHSGEAAGDMATGYAVGSSTAIGISAVSVIAGVAVATMSKGDSNTSTTTTTSTVAGR